MVENECVFVTAFLRELQWDFCGRFGGNSEGGVSFSQETSVYLHFELCKRFTYSKSCVNLTPTAKVRGGRIDSQARSFLGFSRFYYSSSTVFLPPATSSVQLGFLQEGPPPWAHPGHSGGIPPVKGL